METTLHSVRQRGIGATKRTGYFMLITGIVFLPFGANDIFRAFTTGDWPFAFFLPTLSVVFVVVGTLTLKAARKTT
jgi:uncharacterized membrane protein (DUF2068 family)